jgi:hypothetical protein
LVTYTIAVRIQQTNSVAIIIGHRVIAVTIITARFRVEVTSLRIVAAGSCTRTVFNVCIRIEVARARNRATGGWEFTAAIIDDCKRILIQCIFISAALCFQFIADKIIVGVVETVAGAIQIEFSRIVA